MLGWIDGSGSLYLLETFLKLQEWSGFAKKKNAVHITPHKSQEFNIDY